MAFSINFFVSACVVLLAVGLGTSSAQASRQRRRRHNQQANRCSEPTDLRERLGTLLTDDVRRLTHETFYMLPFFRETKMNETEHHRFIGIDDTELRAFNGSQTCPGDEVDEDNPCPTYHSFNINNNRYPKVLMETRCRNCHRCRGILITTDEDRIIIPECKPLFFYTQVLHKTGCHGGVHQYAPRLERIQVGCACKTIPVNFIQPRN